MVAMNELRTSQLTETNFQQNNMKASIKHYAFQICPDYLNRSYLNHMLN